ncbi:MAG TPA: FAD-binding oxidoreductase [Candidatus Limnocylindria bacterium]|jgi:sarcosine oxidase subunit beta|nr:FAD-binding oxidoreductase [Candidatus Limnocylindria bacterium]
MRRTADVVIVGGGIIGASVAYHLTKKGVRDVLVLERDRLGSGSTGKNAGGIRLQFSSEINVRLSQRSLPRIERFADEIGTDPHFRQVGYLFLITEDRDVAPFERSLAMWSKVGVPARRVTAAEANALFAEVRTDDVRFGTFCAKDGYADPSSMMNGYVARAREAGATFIEDAEVVAISCADGKVTGLRTRSDEIATRTLIDAAGPWAAQVAKLAGIDLPIQPLRRHIFVTEPLPGLDRDFPLTIEFASGLYAHRESGGVLLGMADPNEKPGFDDSVNWDFMPTVVERALSRFPFLERATIKTGWAGLYEDTPDKHPIIGAIEGADGFISAAGFSGHGVMHAPVTGELIAELIVDGKTSLDIGPLRASRFASGELVREHNVI